MSTEFLIKPAAYDRATFQTEIREVFTKTINNTANVVHEVHYEIVATVDGQTHGHKSEIYYLDEDLETLETFKPYDQLTKEEVVAWVESKVPLINIHYSLCEILTPQIKQSTPLPWATR